MKNNDEKTFLRLNIIFRIQHILLLVSSLVLAITGLALLWHTTEMGRLLIDFGGGYEKRALIHRIAAIVLIIDGIWHISYFSKKHTKNF